jgi:hypothetical protein
VPAAEQARGQVGQRLLLGGGQRFEPRGHRGSRSARSRRTARRPAGVSRRVFARRSSSRRSRAARSSASSRSARRTAPECVSPAPS